MLGMATESCRRWYGNRTDSSNYDLELSNDNLQKLMTNGMVEEQRRASEGDDPRRRYYRLTSFGRRILAADIERLKSVVQEASVRLRNPRSTRA